MSIVWVVIESGAIYAAAALIQLVMCLTKLNNAGVILEMILAQLSAIAPTLIVVRIGMGVAYSGRDETSHEDVFTSVHDTIPTSSISMSQPGRADFQEHAEEEIEKRLR
ncbi:hypothetical protein H0H81_002021 [Sphagnurus paluster]|uniref:Uncharacterized protein n=1 Tax=Sphagnurus paluster TaxID=117069 RepID=A0A9P7FM99_9AGAR|nr:hypothetical protein H0H81_002021 [Sphagnurus paluster]